MIRVQLPLGLRQLAQIEHEELQLDVPEPVTVDAVLDVLEARYPMLSGTIRDPVTYARRPFLRYFACERDLSHDPPDQSLPDDVINGAQPLIILGAIAGG